MTGDGPSCGAGRPQDEDLLFTDQGKPQRTQPVLDAVRDRLPVTDHVAVARGPARVRPLNVLWAIFPLFFLTVSFLFGNIHRWRHRPLAFLLSLESGSGNLAVSLYLSFLDFFI